jgi:hypothetical protein
MTITSPNQSTWLPAALIGKRLDGTYNSPRAVSARLKIKSFEKTCYLKKMSIKITCGPFGSTLMAAEQDVNGEIILVQPTDISNNLFTTTPGWRISRSTLNEKNL